MVKKHRSEIFLDRHIWDKITHSGVLRDNLVALGVAGECPSLHGCCCSTVVWLRSTEDRLGAFSSS